MSSIIENLENLRENKLKNLEKEEIYKKINDSENNYDLKVSLINIDSKYRNLTPKNITEGNPIFLNNNPIFVTEDSNLVKIFYPNHKFNIGDKFILQNVKNEDIIKQNIFFLLSHFEYLIINLDNHKYNSTNYNKLDKYIYIRKYENINKDKRLLGNIPINSLIGLKKVFTKNEITIKQNLLEQLLLNLNVTEDELNNNFIFVKLPFEYSKINKLNNNIVYTDFYTIDIIFKLVKYDIGGIPLQYLNANFPINSQQFKSIHFISQVDENFFYFNSDVKANYTENKGLDKVYLSKVINSIEGFTNSNNYTIDLKKSFTNVVRLELVSTEIPFIEFNIKNNITNKNNKLYWQNLEDGDFIYSIEIEPGSYQPDSIITKIVNKINETERVYSTSSNKSYNLFEMEIDQSSQEIVFKSFKFETFPNSLKIVQDSNLNNISKLEITVPNNYVSVGDIITISNASSIGDIVASFINTDHEVYEVNKANDTFTVIINTDTSVSELNTSGTGGAFTRIKIPILSRLLFNYNDTFGNLLGFKYMGEPTSITQFKHKISNFDDYEEKTPYDNVGNIDTSNNMINLSGDYFYVFLYLNDYEGLVSNSIAANPFAKILLAGYNGDIMFNTFVSSPLEFDVPISLINQFKVTFRYADNNLVDFKNFSHSFTLRITEKIFNPNRTNLLSKEKTFEENLIDNNYFNS